MMALINRDELIEYMMPYLHNEDELQPADVIADIRVQPVIDAVEVVRCKDCKLRGDYNCPMYWEELVEIEDDGYRDIDWYEHDNTEDDGFCDRGERKEQ